MHTIHVSGGLCLGVAILTATASGGGTGGPQIFFGFEHTALGQAQLGGPVDFGCCLTVSNIGSSGKDGVSIDVGGSGRFATEMVLASPSAPPGAHMQSTSRMQDPTGSSVSCSARFDRLASGAYRVGADYSAAGSPTYRLRVFDAGVFVGEVANLSDASHDIEINASGQTYGCVCTDDGIWTWDGPNGPIVISDEFDDGAPITLVGNRMEVRPMTALPELRLVSVEMTAAGVGSFVVNEESIGVDRLLNARVGQSHLTFDDGHGADTHRGTLTVSNIGSSGKDGVAVELNDIVGGMYLGLSGIDVPAGGSVALNGRGQVGSVPDAPLGTATLQGLSTLEVQASADVAAVGGSLIQWTTLLDGVQTATGVVDSGAIAGTIVNEGGPVQVVGAGVRPADRPCWTFTFRGHRCWIRLGPGPMAPLDELRLLGIDAPPNVSSLSSLALNASNIPSIQITDEVQFCVGDVNGNGTRDFADILQIIATWGPCAACNEDLDGDLEVGFSEILTVIGLWGPCPG